MKYFAYGSNMDEQDLRAWCLSRGCKIPEMILIGKAFLKDYELTFNCYSRIRKGGVANIMPKSSVCTHGLLFNISNDDIEILRKKEGYPKCYEEIPVSVNFSGQFIKDVTTYKVLKSKEISSHQKPTDAYMNLIISNARKFNLPNNYISFLLDIPTQGH
jgi:cation transport regulator ChaC